MTDYTTSPTMLPFTLETLQSLPIPATAFSAGAYPSGAYGGPLFNFSVIETTSPELATFTSSPALNSFDQSEHA